MLCTRATQLERRVKELEANSFAEKEAVQRAKEECHLLKQQHDRAGEQVQWENQRLNARCQQLSEALEAANRKLQTQARDIAQQK